MGIMECSGVEIERNFFWNKRIQKLVEMTTNRPSNTWSFQYIFALKMIRAGTAVEQSGYCISIRFPFRPSSCLAQKDEFSLIELSSCFCSVTYIFCVDVSFERSSACDPATWDLSTNCRHFQIKMTIQRLFGNQQNKPCCLLGQLRTVKVQLRKLWWLRVGWTVKSSIAWKTSFQSIPAHLVWCDRKISAIHYSTLA